MKSTLIVSTKLSLENILVQVKIGIDYMEKFYFEIKILSFLISGYVPPDLREAIVGDLYEAIYELQLEGKPSLFITHFIIRFWFDLTLGFTFNKLHSFNEFIENVIYYPRTNLRLMRFHLFLIRKISRKYLFNKSFSYVLMKMVSEPKTLEKIFKELSLLRLKNMLNTINKIRGGYQKQYQDDYRYHIHNDS